MNRHADPETDKQKMAERNRVRDCIARLGGNINDLSVKFYTRLFQIDPGQAAIFSGSAVTLNRKFTSMMATFRNMRDLESIEPAIQMLAQRHFSYGMRIEHLEPFRRALLLALADQLGDRFTAELRAAWVHTFNEIETIIINAAKQHPEWTEQAPAPPMPYRDETLIEDIGGSEVVRRVHRRLYDALFDHPWIGQFFGGKSKQALINKQTAFMVAAFGGENEYSGEPPALAHMHMLITEEMALEREKVLRRSILAEGLGHNIAERWLRVDRSFWPSINKTSIDECVTRCFGQVPLTIKKPPAG